MRRELWSVAILFAACNDKIPGLCNVDGDCSTGTVCYQGVCFAPEDAGVSDGAVLADDGGGTDAGQQDAVGDGGGAPVAQDAGPEDVGASGAATSPIDAGATTCATDSATYGAGDLNPKNPCQTCNPAASPTSWSSRDNGQVCGTGLVCVSSVCQNGCWIGSAFYSANATKPDNSCLSCQPSLSSSAWSPVPDGPSCTGGVCRLGACESGCWIGGAYYASDAKNPSNACQSCQPGVSTIAWNAIADGKTCGSSLICNAGSCGSGCSIDGTHRNSGDPNPANSCQSCQPASSVSAWTNLGDGVGCGSGEICRSAQCQPACWIDNTFYASDAISASNPCQSCQPAKSTQGWSGLADGKGCDTGKVCSNVSCQSGCWIGSKFYAQGAANPSNACQTCQPTVTATSWTSLSDGSSCGSGLVCSGVTCKAGCVIGGTYYASSAQNPSDPCKSCMPATSTTSWSNTASGASCGTASTSVCVQGACLNGCWIDGNYYPNGTSVATSVCQVCRASLSTKNWSNNTNGLSCGVAVANGAWSCSNGSCSLVCVSGYEACGSECDTPANYCTDWNCGSCGNRCPALTQWCGPGCVCQDQ